MNGNIQLPGRAFPIRIRELDLTLLLWGRRGGRIGTRPSKWHVTRIRRHDHRQRR